MKKIITLLLISVTIYCNAQIILDSTNFNLQHTKFVSSSVNDTSHLIKPGAGGANKVWDFSAIVPIASLKTDTITPYTLVQNGLFPKANIKGCSNSSVGSFCSYSLLTSKSFSLCGIDLTGKFGSMSIKTNATVNPIHTIYNFPLTYNSSFSESYVQHSTTAYLPAPPSPNSDSNKTVYHKTYSYLVDGWGTVITPLGTYNCIRVRKIERNIDTTFNHTQVGGWVLGNVTKQHIDTSYSWITTNFNSVVTMSKYTTKPNESVYRYTFNTPNISVDVEDKVNITKLAIYPNPANNFLTIKSTEKIISATIFNIQGKEQLSTNLNSIDVSALAIGIYFINVKTQEGNTIQKFIKE